MGSNPNFIISHLLAEPTDILDIERRNANLDGDIDLLKSYGALITTEEVGDKARELLREVGYRIINLVVSEGNLAVSKICIDNEVDVNINPNYGQLPLNVAIKSGNPHMVRLLLHHGAWVTRKSSNFQYDHIGRRVWRESDGGKNKE
jgi:ankyrin repeat protein